MTQSSDASRAELVLDSAQLQAVLERFPPREKTTFFTLERTATLVQLTITVLGALVGAYLFLEYGAEQKDLENKSLKLQLDQAQADFKKVNVDLDKLRIDLRKATIELEKQQSKHVASQLATRTMPLGPRQLAVSFELTVANRCDVSIHIGRNIVNVYLGKTVTPSAGKLAGLIANPPELGSAVDWGESLIEREYVDGHHQGANTGTLQPNESTIWTYSYVITVAEERWMAFRADLAVERSSSAGPELENNLVLHYCYLRRTADGWRCDIGQQ